MDKSPENLSHQEGSVDPARRRFLNKAGKIALTVPPALTLLLAAESRHYALALSGGGTTSKGPVGNAYGFFGNAPGQGVGQGNGINGRGNPRH